MDGAMNRWFLDPLYGRHYPADVVASIEKLFPDSLDFIQEGDFEQIAVPTDFLGVNYYTRAVVKAGEGLMPEQVKVEDSEYTDMGWEIHPASLTELLSRLHNDYRPHQIYITENGASYADAPNAEGRITDSRRLEFLRGHFIAAHRAIEQGVPLAGYFVWSLLDNFEWGEGYKERFGITWVDFETQERILKDSALWYREVIAENGVSVK